MEIIIKHNSRETIYEQIVFQIKLLIAKESLSVGDSIPSIRKLSQVLQVSAISVQRAYNELQNEGIIESIPGKGCFISSKINADYIKEEFYGEIQECIIKIIDSAKKNDVNKEEIHKLIDMYWEN